jgi:signal transduction histidine kinase
MALFRRHLLQSLVLALPAALLVLLTINWIDGRHQLALIERIAESHIVDVQRDACLQDPQWFLAGPRLPRPPLADRQMPDADVKLPRPSREQLPFEVFAYDDQYSPSSVAGPRFPDDFKRAMRSTPPVRLVSSGFASDTGAGTQAAIATGWAPGPCAVLLFRQQPAPGHRVTQASLFTGLVVLFFLVAMASVVPTGARIRKLSQAAINSMRSDYTEMVGVSGSDEIGSLGALFNETAADIRRKAVDTRDREEVLRRFVDNTADDVAEPLAGLERRLSQMMAARPDGDVAEAMKEAHRLSTRLRNQAAVIRLRGITDATPRESVNLARVIASVVDSRRSLAAAANVTVDASKATAPVTINADAALIEQAIANVIDNAIVYNKAGGTVRIELQGYDHGQRFKLLVADSGPGVSDEDLAELTANKRFRGDESRTRRPGGRGLGLAIAREVADRFGLQLDLRQPTTGGLEAEFSTR